MVNLVFHLKSDEGHIERFSFDVYMSPLPIFTKIKQPFAWHISFLVRHLSKYSDVPDQLKVKCEYKFRFILNCCVGAKELVYILYYIVYSRHYYAGCNYFWGFCVSRTHRSQCPLWETPLSKSV